MSKPVKQRKLFNIILAGLAILLLGFSFIYLMKIFFHTDPRIFIKTTFYKFHEPKFVKEGELTFFSKKTGEKIVRIDIEVAETPMDRGIGLMYRRSMPDMAGMLFIYQHPHPLAFFMRNTYIPLDIIFVDENRQILTIQKVMKTLSDELIPSYNNTKYVVEVDAGFCEKYGVDTGDYVDFLRLST